MVIALFKKPKRITLILISLKNSLFTNKNYIDIYFMLKKSNGRGKREFSLLPFTGY